MNRTQGGKVLPSCNHAWTKSEVDESRELILWWSLFSSREKKKQKQKRVEGCQGHDLE